MGSSASVGQVWPRRYGLGSASRNWAHVDRILDILALGRKTPAVPHRAGGSLASHCDGAAEAMAFADDTFIVAQCMDELNTMYSEVCLAGCLASQAVRQLDDDRNVAVTQSGQPGLHSVVGPSSRRFAVGDWRWV